MSTMKKAGWIAVSNSVRVLLAGGIIFLLGLVLFHDQEVNWLDKLKWFAIEQQVQKGEY